MQKSTTKDAPPQGPPTPNLPSLRRACLEMHGISPFTIYSSPLCLLLHLSLLSRKSKRVYFYYCCIYHENKEYQVYVRVQHSLIQDMCAPERDKSEVEAPTGGETDSHCRFSKAVYNFESTAKSSPSQASEESMV